MAPSIELSANATVAPASGAAQSFADSATTPIIYTVTAEDNSTAEYEVTVTTATPSDGETTNLKDRDGVVGTELLESDTFGDYTISPQKLVYMEYEDSTKPSNALVVYNFSPSVVSGECYSVDENGKEILVLTADKIEPFTKYVVPNVSELESIEGDKTKATFIIKNGDEAMQMIQTIRAQWVIDMKKPQSSANSPAVFLDTLTTKEGRALLSAMINMAYLFSIDEANTYLKDVVLISDTGEFIFCDPPDTTRCQGDATGAWDKAPDKVWTVNEYLTAVLSEHNFRLWSYTGSAALGVVYDSGLYGKWYTLRKDFLENFMTGGDLRIFGQYIVHEFGHVAVSTDHTNTMTYSTYKDPDSTRTDEERLDITFNKTFIEYYNAGKLPYSPNAPGYVEPLF